MDFINEVAQNLTNAYPLLYSAGKLVGVVLVFGTAYWIGILVLILFYKIMGEKNNPREFNAIIPCLVGAGIILCLLGLTS